VKVVALDAMGVIYPAGDDGDDVKNLLCPFILENNGTKEIPKIESLYRSASLGHISAVDFWHGVNIDPALEDEYLSRHKLSDGLLDFVETVLSYGYQLWCLSNDVSEWSKKLRIKFQLDKFFHGFVISGDVGVRKPDMGIYDYLQRTTGVNASEIMFVDDRIKNLDSASTLGFNTVLFSSLPTIAEHDHVVAVTFDNIVEMLITLE
jgi:putative hydrolase of the HAD superfamily